MMDRGRTFAVVFAVVMLALTTAAQAQKAPPSDEDIARAQKLHEEGVDLYLKQRYTEALDCQEQALRIIDDPGLRYAKALALVALGRTVEAYENLKPAVAGGPEPFENPEIFRRAKTLLETLTAQIAIIEVSCTEPGAKVTLDGRPLLVGPARVSRALLPGEHQVVATKPGFLPVTRDVVVNPRQIESVSIGLIRLEDATRITRRWAPWKPWAVVLGGAAAAGLGGLIYLDGQRKDDRFDEEITRACSDIDGCAKDEVPGPVRDLERDGRRNKGVGVGVMIAGGAVVVAGVVGVLLNQPRAERLTAPGSSISVGIAPTGTVVRVSFSF